MTPNAVLLISAITAMLLSVAAAEGVRCYRCISSKNPNDKPVHPVPTCESGPDNIQDNCPYGCFEGKGSDKYGSILIRGCRNPADHPESGCVTATDNYNQGKGEICVCNKALCNKNIKNQSGRNYGLSNLWISVAICLLMAYCGHDLLN